MDRSKVVAIVTGVIAIALSIAYLLIVQILDFRGEMRPAPIGTAPTSSLEFSLSRSATLAAKTLQHSVLNEHQVA